MDKPKPQRDRAMARLGLIAGVVLVVLVGELLLQSFGDGLARWSYDTPFPWRNPKAPDELVMVYLDPKIKTNLGQPADAPLDRRFYVQLLDRLTADGAKLVFFDILFDSPDRDAPVDAQFAEAMRKQGRVVLVGSLVNQFQGNVVTTAPVPPTPMLVDAAAGWGLAEISPDPADQCVRLLDTGSENFPSAGWVAASVLKAPVTKHSENRRNPRWLNYYCEPLLLHSVNFDEALSREGLRDGYFRDKIVIVGSRPRGGGVAGAEREEFKTPFTRYENASGPAIHALSLLNLLHGDWLVRLAFWQESLLVLLWGIVISLTLARLRPWPAVMAALGAFGIFGLAAVWIQLRYQIWFSWLVPAAAQTSLALVWAVGFRYLIETRRRKKLRHAFAAYLSPHMADRIADSKFDLSLGGAEVEATIMFTDLEGFTSMTETLSPAEVSRILTSYFNKTTRAILEEDGTIIKYMGDAVLAVWGAPLAEPRHAERAVRAGWEMIQAGQQEIAGRFLRTRIGINSGKVLAGNLGSDFRFDYAAIGDTTNTASRLEGLNKHLGTSLLIGEATQGQLSGRFRTRALGRFLMAGKTLPVSVHEVLGVDPPVAEEMSWTTSFDAALRAFTGRQFDEAERLFRQVIQLRGGRDGPAEFYLKQISAARASAPVSGRVWDGVVAIESK